MEPCTTCPRHHTRHPDLFDLLTPDQTGDVQIMLCRDCPGDPWPEWDRLTTENGN